MKKIISLFALLLTYPLTAFYFDVGLAWNTIDETFHSTLRTNVNKSGRDRYEACVNRFAPVVQVGHQFPLCDDWSIGILAEWKYLNYNTPNVSSSRGQILPNATFSSINIFGPNVIRDFTSKTRLRNEVMILGCLGKQIIGGFAYFGLGPVFLTSSNRIYVSSVHIPNEVGDHLISTSVKKHKTIWGGAVQLGYQYCLCSNFFLNLSYTYMQTPEHHFKNKANAAILNGANNPGGTVLFLKRKIKFSAQELMLSMNLQF